MQPPAPAQPAQPIYRAMYDFQGQTASELSFSKGEVLDITKKEGNGIQSLFCVDIQDGGLRNGTAKKDGCRRIILKKRCQRSKPAPPAPPPAPALRPAPAASTGRISSATTKSSFTPNGPAAASAPRPPVANGSIRPIHELILGGVTGAPRPPVANPATGRRVPPPAPSTRPTGNRASATKPPPPPAPKQATGGGQARPNLAANLADMVTFLVVWI